MDRRRVLLGLAAAGVVAGAVWWSGQSHPTPPEVPDRIALARAAGKPVLVEFGSGHCAACRNMKGVLAELEASHGEQMVILDIDFETAEGRRVQRVAGQAAHTDPTTSQKV